MEGRGGSGKVKNRITKFTSLILIILAFRNGVKNRISSKLTALYTLTALLLITIIGTGCTFTEQIRGNNGKIIPLTDKDIQKYNEVFEYVTEQIDLYNDIGKNLPPGRGYYIINGAKVTNLKRMNKSSTDIATDIQIWLLGYGLRPSNPDSVVLAGGMKMKDIDGESWITEWGSTGQPYLVLVHNIEKDNWDRICITNTDVIKSDYDTPEMLEQYGDRYNAAAMELYQKTINKQINGEGENES